MIDLADDLFIILIAGAVAGGLAKRLGLTMLVGYLLAGAVIGRGGLGLIADDAKEIEHLAHAGALLLLFAIGIEFSLEELVRLSRYFFIGGSVQMILVAVPVGVACVLFGVSWSAAVLIASAAALSSTVLVFRALSEWGKAASPQGRRAIGILLFQDAALVPLMLLVPLLAGGEQGADVRACVLLAINSILFVAVVLVVRFVFARWAVPMLSSLRSVELVMLFGLMVLVGFCLGAARAGLPPALGAFAAGLALSGNRLTGQIDALILPYREFFGTVLFVSLGTLFDPSILIDEPLTMTLGLLAVLLLKVGAATVALRATGLSWRLAAGMGLGLAQLGELSFVLLSEGLHANLISPEQYNQMLFIAMGTLMCTPPLLKLGLRATRRESLADREIETGPEQLPPIPQGAMVVGLGPIGRRAASQLEIMGIDVCLIDLSPVTLYAYAQQGFRTVSGDASDPEVLDRASAADCRLAIVCVPEDRIAFQIVRTLRHLNPTCTLVVRCRYQVSATAMKKAGASVVISEEAETSVALERLLERMKGDEAL